MKTHTSDTLHQDIRLAIQTVILRSPHNQTAIARACCRQRTAVSRWLSPMMESLPDLVSFLRLRRFARSWTTRLDRFDLPDGFMLAPCGVPQNWQRNGLLFDEITRLTQALGRLSEHAVTLRRGLLQRWIDTMRLWLNALERELWDDVPHGGDGLTQTVFLNPQDLQQRGTTSRVGAR